MCFFSRTTHVHIRLLRRNVLFIVYNNCPGQHEPQISRQLNTYVIWSRNFFLQSLPGPLPNYDNGFKIPGTVYRRMKFGISMIVFMLEYMLALPTEGLHYVLMWLLVTPYCGICVSHGLKLLPYLSHQVAIKRTFPRGCCIFYFRQSVLYIYIYTGCKRYRLPKKFSWKIIFSSTIKPN